MAQVQMNQNHNNDHVFLEIIGLFGITAVDTKKGDDKHTICNFRERNFTV